MSLCAQMRSDCSRIWDGLHAHPFLRELAQGTLAPEKFRFFLEQDIFYLHDFARCLAMGAAKARDDVELSYFLTDLNQVIEVEIPTNRRLLEVVIGFGAADAGGALIQAPANLAYTSYMQSLSLRGGTLEIMAVLLPCAWSYTEIAQSLAGQPRDEHPVYSPWIAYFSAPENVAMVETMKSDLDSLVEAEGLSVQRRRELGEIFANSSRLERGFWDMAYNLTQWPDLTGSA